MSAPKKPREAPTDDAARMAALFAGNDGAHGTHDVPTRDGLKWEIKSTASTVRRGPTVEMWRQHLSGARPLGVVPVRPDGTCSWGSIDVDVYDGDHLKIVSQVERDRLPLVPCISKSGGLHLFLFLEQPTSAKSVISGLREMSAMLGLAGSEIFPKQTQVFADKGEAGNWMVMPYFGGTFDGRLKRQAGLKKTGAEQTIREFLAHAETHKTTGDALELLGRAAPSLSMPGPGGGKKKTNGSAEKGGWFSDGPPCLEFLAVGGFPEGGRNNALFMVGVYLRKKHSVDWQEQLEKYNRELMRPPLTADEIQSCVRSLGKRDYNYTCRNEPMVRHCHSAKCRTREYGVGEGQYPIISGLTMVKTEPAVFYVDVADKHLEMDADTLQTYTLFHRACMNKGLCFGPMKQSDWLNVLGRAFETMVPEDASPDSTPDAQFHEHLEMFLTNMQRGEQREDILSGRPWEDQEAGLHWFLMKDLKKHLDREKMRYPGPHWVEVRLRAIGGLYRGLTISGRTQRAWNVPSTCVQAMPELPTPKSSKRRM